MPILIDVPCKLAGNEIFPSSLIRLRDILKSPEVLRLYMLLIVFNKQYNDNQSFYSTLAFTTYPYFHFSENGLSTMCCL